MFPHVRFLFQATSSYLFGTSPPALVCSGIRFSLTDGSAEEHRYSVELGVPSSAQVFPSVSPPFPFSLPPSGLPASAFLRKVSVCKILPLTLSSRKSVVRLSYSRLSPVLGTPPENLSGSSHPLLIGRSPILALALAN